MALKKTVCSSISWVRAALHRGGNFYCPLCRRGFRKFLPAGADRRPDAMCPGCGSLERHRLMWVALEGLWRAGELRRGGRMLHVAPEPVLTQLFRKDFDYLSADLDGTRAMVAMDITRIGYQDGYFDAIMCNHVLEHVPDDRQALAELCRVMAVGGWGCIQVPMKGEQTQEDLSIVSPADRARLYGQEDHVRQYGTDFRDRLQAAGFFVRVVEKSTLLSPEELERFSVACEQEVVLVRKLNRKGV